ncbi:hypothetical protein GCM10010400_26130 [Streptomyces aculeolatus]
MVEPVAVTAWLKPEGRARAAGLTRWTDTAAGFPSVGTGLWSAGEGRAVGRGGGRGAVAGRGRRTGRGRPRASAGQLRYSSLAMMLRCTSVAPS